MEKVTSLSQYNELAKSGAQRCGATNINCYLMPSELTEIIPSGQLYYQRQRGGHALFWDKHLYTQMYLNINPELPLELTPQEKPVVTDFVGVKLLPEKSRKVAGMLADIGFKETCTSLRMVIDTDFALQGAERVKLSGGVRIVPAEEGRADEIMALWRTCFHPVDSKLPTMEELVAYLRNGYIFCALDEAGNLCGAVQTEFHKGVALGRHTAVAADGRRKGIGWALKQELFKRAKQLGIKRVYLWVEEGNSAAIEFHLKTGYTFDGRVTRQYTLKP